MESNTTTSDSQFNDTFSVYIDKAEAMFNAAVSKRYSLPFTTIPPMARELSFEMAAWYSIRAFFSRDWPNRNDMLDDFKIAFDTVEMLRKGELRLTLTDGSLIAPLTDTIQSNRENEDQIFEMDEPRQWRVDKDRLDSLKNARE